MRAAVVALALLAGCVAPSAPADDSALVASAFGTLSFTGCEQTHTFATYPVEAFESVIPEGWALQPGDPAGRTAQFYLSGSRCANATATLDGRAASIEEMKEIWGYVFVIPPEGANDSFDGELWPLGAVVSHGDALAVYSSWGIGDLAVQGETEIAIMTPAPGAVESARAAAAAATLSTSRERRGHSSVPDAVTSRTWSSAAGETFEVDAAAQGTPGAFHGGAFRVWIPAEEGVAGAFVHAWPEGGTDLGLGGGTMRYEGPLLNAPPIGPVLVHHVRDVSGSVTLLPA